MPKQSGALSVLGSGLMALLIWAQHSLVWAQAPAPLVPALGNCRKRIHLIRKESCGLTGRRHRHRRLYLHQ